MTSVQRACARPVLARSREDTLGRPVRLERVIQDEGCALAARVVLEGRTLFLLRLNPDRVYGVGRGPAAELPVDDGAVSRHHGVLRHLDGRGWVYTDSSSTNGTLLVSADSPGGPHREVRGDSAPVRAGDVLLVGTERVALHLDPAGASAAEGHRPITGSAAGRDLEAFLERVASSRAPVFFLGASGTGKTHAAWELHKRSPCKGEFIAVNCASLPADPVALQARFLGNAVGAYTGAVRENKGLLFAADEGTLFLDEVESLPAAAQGFLLDVLEGKGGFMPLGDHVQRRPPRFRLVSASKAPLQASGLRRDLCFRLLSGDKCEIPGLDRRRADIPGFMDRFATEELRNEGADGTVAFLPDADAWASQQAAWPGEVRELRATVQAAVREAIRLGGRHGAVAIGAPMLQRHAELSRQMFGDDDGAVCTSVGLTPLVAGTLPPAPPLARSTHQLNAEHLRQALAAEHGNLARTARSLGIALNTLKRKMARFGLRG